MYTLMRSRWHPLGSKEEDVVPLWGLFRYEWMDVSVLKIDNKLVPEYHSKLNKKSLLAMLKS